MLFKTGLAGVGGLFEAAGAIGAEDFLKARPRLVGSWARGLVGSWARGLVIRASVSHLNGFNTR